MDKGAHFFRCDFQVHTPRDINWQGHRPIADDERREYARGFIKACREKGLKAVAITDHHDLGFFPYIREASKDELTLQGTPVSDEDRILVFPGTELTLAVPCQALLLFDEDFPVEFFDPDQPMNPTSEDEIRSLLPIQGYSQKQLSGVGVRDGELTRFVESAGTRDALSQLTADAKSMADAVRRAFQELEEKRNHAKSSEHLSLQLSSVEQQLNALKAVLKGLSPEDQRILDRNEQILAGNAAFDQWQQDAIVLTDSVQRALRALEPLPHRQPAGHSQLHGEQITRAYIPFADASAGQQATALLRVLLNQDGPPLVIDQPEDDLDNQVIYEVAEHVGQAKQRRQIIFTSHNANLVVNGDADLVVAFGYRTLGEQSGGEIKAEGQSTSKGFET